MGGSESPGTEECQILLVLQRALSGPDVYRITASRRRVLQLRPRPALRSPVIPHTRHILAAARVARQDDAW